MRIEHVIHLGTSRCELYSWDQDRFARVAAWDLAAGSITPLVDTLQIGAPGPVAIIVDLVEEEHVREKMARLGTRDRQAVLARKLARAFPRTDFRTAILQGRDNADSQGQRVLMSALTKPDNLRLLVNELARAHVPVATITSPALLCGPILGRLRPGIRAASATMLVSRQREGSLRLSFFRGTELVGSRLLRSSLAAPSGDVARLVRQLEESVRYFEPAFAPSAGDPVDVLLLAEPDLDPAEIVAVSTTNDGYRLQVPDMVALAAALGIRAPVAAGNADRLYIELLRRHRPAGSFAGPADLRHFKLHQLRVYGRAACVALAATGVLGTGLNAIAIVEGRTATRETQAAIASINRALRDTDGSREASGADPLEMQLAVTAWEALLRHRINPREILLAISAAVSLQPRIQVDSIQWSPVASIAVAADGEDAGATEAGDTDESSTDGDGMAADASTPEQGDAGQRVRITVKGRIEPFDRNYRLAFAELETFMEHLRADPRVAMVRARKQPLDVDPRSTLSGEMSIDRKEDEATFAVDIMMRMQDGPA